MEEKDRERLKQLFERFLNEKLFQITFGNPVNQEGFKKAKIRPLFIQGRLLFQAEEFRGNQVYHRNLPAREVLVSLTTFLAESFRQCEIRSEEGWAQVLVSKKGRITIKEKAQIAAHQGGVSRRRLSHNRTKSYILEEGKPIPFLIDLGVMTEEGKIIQAKYDKFRQINRFLEFIEDILPHLSWNKENTILDFGCGKSYLTFAIYHYLKVIKGYDIRIIGLDLKEDVISRCNELSRRYGFDSLQFCHGDIASYEGTTNVDMVVTLHACDTATDYALAKAVNWGAKVILSVPCCQHELNQQIDQELMRPVLQYGLLKERLAALITDGLRAEILEYMGYRTQILEFIDMEHTPKNILIRAVKQGKPKDNGNEIQKMLTFWHVEPTLYQLLMR